MRRRREIPLFSISFLDLLSGALGAVIILYVALPKTKPQEIVPQDNSEKIVLEKQLESRQKEIQNLEKMLAVANEKLAKQKVVTEGQGQGKDLDIGFKFKGKKIVFIIDTSYSMTEEDRMGQVKAGLKMLLTSLAPGYSVDVVQFPYGTRAPFKTLWGTIKDTNGENKAEAMEFIYDMKPDGGTPTRDALLFVLKNYSGISDIVLLTDGAPSLHNSNKKDDIFDILNNVLRENKQEIQISAIGVGSNFIKDKTSEQYRFLSLLAEQNNGFFVGF